MTSSPLRSEKLDLRLTPGAKQTLQRAEAQRSVTDVVLDLEGMARRC
jgi:anti-anti-sigma regulatory factor